MVPHRGKFVLGAIYNGQRFGALWSQSTALDVLCTAHVRTAPTAIRIRLTPNPIPSPFRRYPLCAEKRPT